MAEISRLNLFIYGTNLFANHNGERIVLLSNPVQWASQVAKTKLRVCIFILVHIGLVTLSLFGIFKSIPLESTDWSFSSMMAASSWLYFVGAVQPGLYLFAMYGLLKLLRKQNGDA